VYGIIDCGWLTWARLFHPQEPKHGSDANWMETRAVKDTKTGEWVINGAKMWNSGMQ
jgi:alkylation response protein AidB-like acyl-CoA dehydrogenase